MKREIKFRVWDKEGNNYSGWKAQMIYPDKWSEQVEESRSLFPHPYKSNRFEFMQFVGLLDKNGKEIYDGDVLGSGGRVIGHIEGGVRGYCYDVVYVKPTGDKRWSLYACVTNDYNGDIEVIGNIYQNPELLTP